MVFAPKGLPFNARPCVIFTSRLSGKIPSAQDLALENKAMSSQCRAGALGQIAKAVQQELWEQCPHTSAIYSPDLRTGCCSSTCVWHWQMNAVMSTDECGCKWVPPAWTTLKMSLERNITRVLRKRCKMLLLTSKVREF